MIYTEEMPRYAESYLAEWIKEIWKHYKDEQHPISGDYYYDQIISGVYLNQPVNIHPDHFPLDLRIQLKQFTDKEISKIITKSIKEFFGYVQGQLLMQQAEKQKRFHWKFVK